MATFTWILLMLFVQQTHCHSTRKGKSHHHHTSAKKSFLADAMKEMEYGENAIAKATTGANSHDSTKAVAPQENNHDSNKHKKNHTNKKIVNEDHFVARIFPSKVITEVSKKEQDKVEKDKKHGDETPKLESIHTGDEVPKNKAPILNVSTSTIVPSSTLQPQVLVSSSITTSNTKTSDKNSSKPESEKVEVKNGNQGEKKKKPTKNIKDAIRLLQAFVEKLLKENETIESSNHSSKAKPTIKQSEKKDILKQTLPVHGRTDDGQQSTVISGIKYNLAPVYRIKAKFSKDGANNSNSTLEQQQQQQPQQQQQEPKTQAEQQQQGQQEKQQKQNQELGSQQQQERRQQQQPNNIQNKLQGDIEKLKQEETVLRQSLAEKELEIQKLKIQNSPSVNIASSQVVETSTQTPNMTNNSTKQDEISSNDDQKQDESSSNDGQKQDESSSNDGQMDMKFASLKGVPPELLMKLKTILEKHRRKSQKFVSKQEVHSRKAFETARKLVKAALAREQLYKAEQDFFEKVKEMMNKTSTANLVKDNANEQNESNINNDEGSTIKDYIQQIEEQSRLDGKVRRTSPSTSPLQEKNASNITTKSLHDSMSTGLRGVNSSQSTTALDLQASAAKLLKQLNHTKGPAEKNVEAAAHLEEKVAEQQDEMYEKLIRQTLGKGMGGDDEDDEEDEDEEGVARNVNGESRPPEEEMMGRQESYGDFQDSDEEAQSRSDIKYINKFNKNETLPSIEEDSLLSLRDKINRPPK